ncbi:MAG: HDIG domain-containing metalloprotein [Fervidobacterium sp.]|jgi:putative nucleotidyltransferase with HDIG domain
MQRKTSDQDMLKNEAFIYDGIILALIISVANNIYDLSLLGLANEFILILVIWYGIVEHFIRNSNILNTDIRYRIFFYSVFLIGGILNTVIYKTYGITFIPIVAVPMLITLLIDYEFGASAGLILSLSTAFHHHDFFMFLHFFPQVFIVTYMLKNTKSRIQVTKAGLFSSIASIVMILLQEPVRHFYFSTKDYIIVFLNPIISSVVVLGILPYIEVSTRIYSNIGLSEISTINHQLLKLLSVHAPGTYYHSMRVAELSERAAEDIGANTVLVRACAYYHDIGKMRNPDYFVENLKSLEDNPHNSLPPEVSSKIIMKHIEDGIEIARKYRLPIQIEMAIPQHHGTRIQKYFYAKALQVYGNANIEEFHYKGPKPKTKELGIIMLADVVEAISKSADRFDLSQMKSTIEKIVVELFEEGQLDDTGLTVNELRIIVESFTTVFENLSKHRIEYPSISEEIETTG